jgi:glucose/arabinose dehydrogenase
MLFQKYMLAAGMFSAAFSTALSVATTGLNAAEPVKGVDASAAIDAETGIRLPKGFKATVFADGVGTPRHITASKEGWVYAPMFRSKNGMGGVAMKDDDGDGKADQVHYFAEGRVATAIHIVDNWLYYGEDLQIVRWNLNDGPIPKGEPEVIVSGFPKQRAHANKPMAFDGKGNMYVNVGVPSNNCMVETRKKGSPGQKPCPELERHGGIWRFDAEKAGQDQVKDGYRYSTGHRNVNALDWNPYADALYIAQHGRDQLNSFYPDMFDAKASAELPAEEFHRIEDGDNLGWPYSYYDQFKGERMLSPEYGGDGKTVASEGKKPLIGFPGHWAPNDLIFVKGKGLPSEYKMGAFIGFHGSWNRAPEPQQGYRIVYVPLDKAGNISGDWVTFADGFAGEGPIRSPRNAKHRPMGLAEGSDGALYITSMMSGGRVWRVTYEGK